LTSIEFQQKMSMLRAKYRMSTTSGFRTVAHNKKVGGHPESFHMLGLAEDVVMDSNFVFNLNDLYSDCTKLGLQMIYEGDHYHIEANL